MRYRRRSFVGELVEAGAIAVLSAGVAVVGTPQPLAIIVAAAGGITATIAATITINRHRGGNP